MIAELSPLSDVTVDAIRLLYRELGIVNTLRFIRQFTNGFGNYTEESAERFGDQTLDDLLRQSINAIGSQSSLCCWSLEITRVPC